MTQTQNPEQEVTEKYSVENIPKINPREFNRGKTYVGTTPNEEEILAAEGDVIDKGFGGLSVILAVKESTGIVHYDLKENYYGFIPAEILQEDLTPKGDEEPRARIIDDPWGLRNNEDSTDE